MMNSPHISQSYSQKITSVKTTESCHFFVYNTELICKEYLTAT